MTTSRSLLVWATLLSLLFSVASAVALPDNDDHKWARHVTKIVTVTATSIQTCSTHISLGTISSGSSVPTSCPSVAAQITKTITDSFTITVTSGSTILSTANNPKAITVTKTDTVTSVISGSKGASATSVRVPAYVVALAASKLIRDSQIIFETWLSGDFPDRTHQQSLERDLPVRLRWRQTLGYSLARPIFQ